MTNLTRWNKRDKVWGSANSLVKWRFRSRRRRRCVNTLIKQVNLDLVILYKKFILWSDLSFGTRLKEKAWATRFRFSSPPLTLFRLHTPICPHKKACIVEACYGHDLDFMHASLHCLSSQNNIAKSFFGYWINFLLIVFEEHHYFHIYKTIQNR